MLRLPNVARALYRKRIVIKKNPIIPTYVERKNEVIINTARKSSTLVMFEIFEKIQNLRPGIVAHPYSDRPYPLSCNKCVYRNRGTCTKFKSNNNIPHPLNRAYLPDMCDGGKHAPLTMADIVEYDFENDIHNIK